MAHQATLPGHRPVNGVEVEEVNLQNIQDLDIVKRDQRVGALRYHYSCGDINDHKLALALIEATKVEVVRGGLLDQYATVQQQQQMQLTLQQMQQTQQQQQQQMNHIQLQLQQLSQNVVAPPPLPPPVPQPPPPPNMAAPQPPPPPNVAASQPPPPPNVVAPQPPPPPNVAAPQPPLPPNVVAPQPPPPIVGGPPQPPLLPTMGALIALILQLQQQLQQQQQQQQQQQPNVGAPQPLPPNVLAVMQQQLTQVLQQQQQQQTIIQGMDAKVDARHFNLTVRLTNSLASQRGDELEPLVKEAPGGRYAVGTAPPQPGVPFPATIQELCMLPNRALDRLQAFYSVDFAPGMELKLRRAAFAKYIGARRLLVSKPTLA